ncbi:MFS transporter [Candidatus Parcubacteria bacterium]|nr:MFS transporter [Candidatus Parcubacteria bacterium]
MHSRNILAVGNFFLAVSETLVSYTLLSYLSSFVSETNIGLAIALGGSVAIIAFFSLPRLVARYGAQELALSLTFVNMVLLFAAAAAPHTIVSAVFVILSLSLQPLIFYELDLLLEATVSNENFTGRVRTFFLTGGNVGVLVAPLLIGTILAHVENYTYILFAAAAALVPFVILFAAQRLPEGAILGHSHLRDTFQHIARDRDLMAVTIGHLVLYLFYIWAPLYIPIYLHSVLGIPWSTLGWMFAIMLMPYLLIEYPAGWVADRFLGDKELMMAGFLIAGSALAVVGFLAPSSALLTILAVLIATRVGAAFIESMTEGHFFRRVSEKDIVSVSVFRGVWPLANAIAPLVGSLILFLDGYQMLFLLTGGFVLIAGTLSTSLIKDFR